MSQFQLQPILWMLLYAHLTVFFARTAGHLTKDFPKSQMPGGLPRRVGIIAVGIDSYIRGYYLTVVSYSYEILKCLRILQGKRSRFAKPNSSNRYNKIHKPRGKQIICKRVSCCRDEIYILAWTRWWMLNGEKCSERRWYTRKLVGNFNLGKY